MVSVLQKFRVAVFRSPINVIVFPYFYALGQNRSNLQPPPFSTFNVFQYCKNQCSCTKMFVCSVGVETLIRKPSLPGFWKQQLRAAYRRRQHLLAGFFSPKFVTFAFHVIWHQDEQKRFRFETG